MRDPGIRSSSFLAEISALHAVRLCHITPALTPRFPRPSLYVPSTALSWNPNIHHRRLKP
jgi:hypothetical protein